MSFNNYLDAGGGSGGGRASSNFLPSINYSAASSLNHSSVNADSVAVSIKNVLPAGQISDRCRGRGNGITVQHRKEAVAALVKKNSRRSQNSNSNNNSRMNLNYRNSSLPNLSSAGPSRQASLNNSVDEEACAIVDGKQRTSVGRNINRETSSDERAETLPD